VSFHLFKKRKRPSINLKAISNTSYNHRVYQLLTTYHAQHLTLLGNKFSFNFGYNGLRNLALSRNTKIGESFLPSLETQNTQNPPIKGIRTRVSEVTFINTEPLPWNCTILSRKCKREVKLFLLALQKMKILNTHL